MARKLPYPKSKLVCVFWEDAEGSSCRVDADAVGSLSVATNANVGWIVAETEKAVRLCHGTSTTGELDCFTILRANIIEVVEVVPQKRPKRKRVENESETDAEPSGRTGGGAE